MSRTRLSILVVIVALVAAVASIIYATRLFEANTQPKLPAEVRAVLLGKPRDIHVEVVGVRNGYIPRVYTCDAENPEEPRITWSRVEGAKAYLVLVLDPDAPHGTFVHLIAYDGYSNRWPAPGYKLGLNSAGRLGWFPICPPPGDKPHHYYFIVAALREPLNLDRGASLDQVMSAARDRVISYGYTVYVYKR